MSFILEALKKADAERDRGAVPDLHAQVLLPEAAFGGEAPARARPWIWLVAGAAAALLAIAGWQWSTSGEAPQAAPPPAAMAVARPPGPAAPAEATRAGPQATADAQAAAGAPVRPPANLDAQRPMQAHGAQEAAAEQSDGAGHAQRDRPRKPPASTAARAPRESTAQAATAPAGAGEAKPRPPPGSKAESNGDSPGGASAEAKAATKAAPPRAAAAQADEPVPLLSELPDEIRRQVPALKLGGLVYSTAPASRMLIVNGDVQREGSTVAPGLKLERIKPKSAVFSLRGQRFELPV